MRRLSLGLLLVALAGGALAPLAAARSGFTWEEMQIIDKQWPNTKVTSTGLRLVVMREGTGERPKPGERVKVLYKGMFLDGRVFDQKLDPAVPFVFRLGRGEIIEGWEEGIGLMRKGEKTLMLIPYDLAYGSRGQVGRIPRQTSLMFEVELLEIMPFVPSSGKPPAESAKEAK